MGRDCGRVPVNASGEAIQLAVDDQGGLPAGRHSVARRNPFTRAARRHGGSLTGSSSRRPITTSPATTAWRCCPRGRSLVILITVEVPRLEQSALKARPQIEAERAGPLHRGVEH